MLLCVIGFQLVVHENFSERIEHATFGFAVTTGLFIYSFGGQLIMDKSSSVSENLYEIDKDLIVSIQRAQRSSFIKVGFYKASLPLFTTIMNSTFSLITLLKSFIE
jgi:hypothetical protein